MKSKCSATMSDLLLWKRSWFLVRIVPIVRKTVRTIQIGFFKNRNVFLFYILTSRTHDLLRNPVDSWSNALGFLMLFGRTLFGIPFLVPYLLSALDNSGQGTFCTAISVSPENLSKFVFPLLILFIMPFFIFWTALEDVSDTSFLHNPPIIEEI